MAKKLYRGRISPRQVDLNTSSNKQDSLFQTWTTTQIFVPIFGDNFSGDLFGKTDRRKKRCRNLSAEKKSRNLSCSRFNVTQLSERRERRKCPTSNTFDRAHRSQPTGRPALPRRPHAGAASAGALAPKPVGFCANQTERLNLLCTTAAVKTQPGDSHYKTATRC